MKNKKVQNVLGSEYHNKPVHIKCIVSGKSISPYCIPKKVKINCSPENDMDCKKCRFKHNKTLEIVADNENILLFIDIPTTQIAKTLKIIFNIPCSFSYESIEMQNIERLFIIPPTYKEKKKAKLAPIAYYIGHGIDVNTLYEMSGYTTVDPKNQTTVHIFTKAQKAKSDLDSFNLTIEKHNELKEFCVGMKTADDVFKYLYKLYDYYAHNVTKIYDRFDLHLCLDLAFRSVLSFRFDKELINKGWMDVMIIGDTRCGKGYVAERLSKYFDIGEVISGDNLSFAGLVGGLQQYNKNWVITWGKIPLNDMGLVIIDEASEIQHADWTRLSRIRSEGIAEITKIHTQITNARTRIIFISNPILKTISNYSYGIQSLADIVKAPEDIARFDYVLVVAHNEVEIEDINKEKKLVDTMYSPKLEQDLLLWTWCKKPSEIVFSESALNCIYKKSIELANDYTFSIPLIQGENIRYKLAKIAISFASRLYSNKQDGRILFVDQLHVECAITFINMIYKKEVCGYHAMSQIYKIQETYSEEQFAKIEKYLNAFTLHKKEILRCLLMNNSLTVNDISEHNNLEKEIAREIISKLLSTGCIHKRGTIYIKNPGFVSWLKNKMLYA